LGNNTWWWGSLGPVGGFAKLAELLVWDWIGSDGWRRHELYKRVQSATASLSRHPSSNFFRPYSGQFLVSGQNKDFRTYLQTCRINLIYCVLRKDQKSFKQDTAKLDLHIFATSTNSYVAHGTDTSWIHLDIPSQKPKSRVYPNVLHVLSILVFVVGKGHNSKKAPFAPF
jgi:hypothetical protein